MSAKIQLLMGLWRATLHSIQGKNVSIYTLTKNADGSGSDFKQSSLSVIYTIAVIVSVSCIPLQLSDLSWDHTDLSAHSPQEFLREFDNNKKNKTLVFSSSSELLNAFVEKRMFKIIICMYKLFQLFAGYIGYIYFWLA